jgi:hypothetical protein
MCTTRSSRTALAQCSAGLAFCESRFHCSRKGPSARYVLNTHLVFIAGTKGTGASESARWLEERGLDTSRVTRWFVEITMETNDLAPSKFELNIYPEEWGFILRSGPRVSSLRVTDVPFVHGRDDHHLLDRVTSLDRIGELVARIESEQEIKFQRRDAVVRSNLVRASSVVRSWLNTI